MLRKRSMLALLAGVLLSSTALAACPASASVGAGQNWVQASIAAQLARKPGGVVEGNSVRYVREGVTLTYQPPVAPGSAAADDFAGCSTNEVCLYTTSNVIASGVRLSTGSLWCPWENTNNLLDLRDYGLAGQIRSADNEGGWWAEGIWSRLGVRGEQWKMDPHGILYNLSTTNITYLNVCIKQSDLEY
jgi:hypothetical protein